MSDDHASARYLSEIGCRPVAAPALQLAWARSIDAAQQAFNAALLACAAARERFVALLAATEGAAPDWLARDAGDDAAAPDTLRALISDAREPPPAEFRQLLWPMRLRCEFMQAVCKELRACAVRDADTRTFLALADGLQRRIRGATDRLVHANQRLVVSLARQYRYAPMPFMDLVQEGNLGLLRAIERFDPARGARVSTYAVWWVRRAMVYAIARQGHAVRPPVQQYWAARRLQRALNRIDGQSGGRDQLRVVARAFGMSTAEVQENIAVLIPAGTLHAAVDGADGVSRLERLADADGDGPENRVIEQDLRRAVSALLELLPQRQAKVLRMRFGIGVHEGFTLEQIAQQQGVTRERIRQIEAQALDALRGLEAAGLLRACLT